MKKVLIVTGGSGGHITPALSLYEHLKYTCKVSLVTDQRGEKFINKEKYKFNVINTPNILSRLVLIPIKILSFIFSFFKSIFFLYEKKFDILISTGGYSTVPLCISARLLGVKLFLIEPNMVLGRSNKFMLNYAEKILCYNEKLLNFPTKFKNKIKVIQPLLLEKNYKSKKNKNFDFKKKIKILILGGSQGAKFFDEFSKEFIIKLSKIANVEVMQQMSNRGKIKDFENLYNKNGIKNKIFDFDIDMADKMGDYNIAITRCGASTLGELTHLNVPFIGIPFPFAKDNHQLENAISYEKNKCCWVFEQKNTNADLILDLFDKFIKDNKIYYEKYQNIVKISCENKWDIINKKINNIVNEN